MGDMRFRARDADELRIVALLLALVRRLDPAQRQVRAGFLDAMASALDPLDAADWWVLTGETPKEAAP